MFAGKIFFSLNYTHLIDINRYNSQYNLGLGNGNSGTIQSCPEVVECLNKQDFDAFVKHLEASIEVIRAILAREPSVAQGTHIYSHRLPALGLKLEF